MPEAVKTTAMMTKHLTAAERAAREAAEKEIMPDRGRPAKLKMPALMSKNTPARKYWNQIVKRMEGYSILDDLDSDTLGIYCVQLARYDALCKTIQMLTEEIEALRGADAKTVADLIAKLDSMSGKAQRTESNILQYADKLGLTPAGRARLAQKRAEQAAEDPDADLFGD